MLRNLIISAFAILLTSCAANRGFIADNADATVANHTTIAILPFKVEFNEQIKRTSRRGRQQEGYWQEQARIAGLDMQQAMFVSVAQQVEKGRIEKVIQNFQQTNRLLEQNSVPIFAIPNAEPQALGNILNADAVLRGSTRVDADMNGMMMMGGMNNGTTTLLELFDTQTGQLIWSETVTKRPNGPMDTPQRMAQMAADDLSKMLPYRVRR